MSHCAASELFGATLFLHVCSGSAFGRPGLGSVALHSSRRLSLSSRKCFPPRVTGPWDFCFIVMGIVLSCILCFASASSSSFFIFNSHLVPQGIERAPLPIQLVLLQSVVCLRRAALCCVNEEKVGSRPEGKAQRVRGKGASRARLLNFTHAETAELHMAPSAGRACIAFGPGSCTVRLRCYHHPRARLVGSYPFRHPLLLLPRQNHRQLRHWSGI